MASGATAGEFVSINVETGPKRHDQGECEMAVWVIRGGNEGEFHGERDLKAGCVAIGWGRMGDLTPLTTKDAVCSRMRQVWPLWIPPQVANMGGQVWKFKDSIQVGDLVFRRLKEKPNLIAIGEVTGDYQYYPDFVDFPHYSHIRAARWINREVRRDSFDPEMLKVLGQLRTVFKVKQERVKEQVRAIVLES